MKVGYARVSRSDQELRSQLDALERAGCERVYSEHVSAVAKRTQYLRMLEHLRAGDTVVVVRLDRLGRRMHELIATVHELNERGVHVLALAQGIDTSSPAGKLQLGVFAALAETERELIRERTREGVAAAKARGKHCGRPLKLDAATVALVAQLKAQGHGARAIAKAAKLSITSVKRALEIARERAPNPRQTRLQVE